MSKTRQPSHVINGSFKVSAPSLLCGRRVAGTASTANAPKRLGYEVSVAMMAGMAGRRSGWNGCFGAAAAGVLHGARIIPTVAGRSMRALSRLADVAGFWTLDRTTITGRSAVILRQHTTPFRPMIVPFDDLELVHQSMRTLEPPDTHKFRASMRRTPNWANSTLGCERFFKAGPRVSGQTRHQWVSIRSAPPESQR